MVAVPLLSGVAGSTAGEFIQSFPLNLEPVAIDSKISKGQFRAPPGAVQVGIGPGADRGGIVWNNRHFRVFGTSFCELSAAGTLTVIGDVGSGPRCRFDYSFDRLIINSAPRLYYYDGTTLSQVTDPDLGNVIDAMWADGYTMTTDGTYVPVTELDDPTQVKPLKYGSAESDPDPITGLLRYREEAYVFNRNTIQAFQNVGGNGFPFQTIRGATIPFGCTSARAKAMFGDGFAFVGSARNEQLNVYAAGQRQAVPFGNEALCNALNAVADETAIEIEVREYEGEQRLIIHLPTESWCYLARASQTIGQPIWFRLSSGGGQPYRLRNMILFAGKRWVGDSQSGAYGYLDDEAWDHFDAQPDWEFEAGMLYNSGKPFLVRSAELVGLPGRGPGVGSIFMSMTRDGETWSPERALTVAQGDRRKRLQWRPHARVANYMGFKFRGVGVSLPGIASLEVEATPLRAEQ